MIVQHGVEKYGDVSTVRVAQDSSAPTLALITRLCKVLYVARMRLGTCNENQSETHTHD